MPEAVSIGSAGEDAAAVFLERHGFRIIGRNYRKPYGEIDIVASRERIVHFIEVKTSKFFENSDFTPEIRVNARKIKAIKRICETFLREGKFSDEQRWQIDVVSVILDDMLEVKEIRHIENAVFEKPY